MTKSTDSSSTGNVSNVQRGTTRPPRSLTGFLTQARALTF